MVTSLDILTHPLGLALVTVAVVALLYSQRTLSWREYRALHGLKQRLLPRLAARTGFFLISQKGYRDDAEYLTTREGSVEAVWRRLVREGGSPHLISSLKRRPLPDGATQLSDAHVVWTHADGTQTEAYLFANPGAGTVDVYAHHETSVADADGHLTEAQTDGDPRGVVRMALGMDV